MELLAYYLRFKLAGACGTNTGFLPSLYDKMPCGVDANGVQTIQLNSMADILILVGNVLRILMAVAGGIALIVILAASIYYIASAGDPGRIKKAKDILTNMGIGLVIIIASYALVTYIAQGF